MRLSYKKVSAAPNGKYVFSKLKNRKLQTLTAALFVAIAGGVGVYLAGSSEAFTDAEYPIKRSADNKYLVSQNGQPFFYLGDTAWMLLSTLSRSEAAAFMDARKAQGYNTIQTSMVNWDRKYSKFGVTAFQNGDISKPNDAYFATIDATLQDAAERNIQLMMNPLWLNNNNSGSTNGLPTIAQWQAYGQYLGARYKNFPNIIWLIGGDHDVINTWGADSGFDYTPYMDALALGIKIQDPNHLMTYHPALDTKTLGNKSWLDFYSFQRNLANQAPWSYTLAKDYTTVQPTKPILNIEPAYETKDALSNTVTTPYMVRRNAWWTQLAGSIGIAYGGSSKIWDIGPGTWQTDVNLPGARQVGYIRQILEPHPWQKLVPDWNHAAVTSGYGTYGNNDYVTAGKASDGTLLVAYTPNSRTLTINMASLAGPVQAYWYDPSNAQATNLGNFPNTGSKTFTTPVSNAAGDKDFILLLTSAPPTPDTTPPIVSVTQPAGGSTVSGTVNLSADANDPESPVRVQFMLDGAPIGSLLTAAPYTLAWNSSAVANGTHVLTAVATNNAGLSTTSTEVSLNVQNEIPTPPTVQLTAPAVNAVLAGAQAVSAAASDAKGVASVQFKLNGNNLGSADTTAPYSISWDTTTVANGAYSLTAVATNINGLSTTSSAVSVTVQNNTPAGLTARYYKNINLSGTPLLTRTDSTINFNWGNGSPASNVPANNFSVRWTGQLRVPTTGNYTIGFNGDDGYRVYVNGQRIINNWRDQSPTYRTGNINLTGGRNYSITVEYYERGGGAVAQLYWTGPGISRTIIPAANLLPQ